MCSHLHHRVFRFIILKCLYRLRYTTSTQPSPDLVKCHTLVKSHKMSNTQHCAHGKFIFYILSSFLACALEYFLCSENNLHGLMSYFWSSNVWKTIDQRPVALESVLYVIVFPSSSTLLSIAYLVRICTCQRSLSAMFVDLNFKYKWPAYYHSIADQTLWPSHSPDFIFLFLHPKAKSTVSI